MKCLEFQRRRGDSRKFVIKAEILFTTQFAGISSPGFHMLDEMQELGTKLIKVKCAAPFFVGTGPLSFLLGQLIGFPSITKEEYILKE